MVHYFDMNKKFDNDTANTSAKLYIYVDSSLYNKSDTVTFGTIEAGSSVATKTIKLVNAGSNELSLINITFENDTMSSFLLNPSPSFPTTIDSSGITFDIEFDPLIALSANVAMKITVETSDGSSTIYTVHITAESYITADATIVSRIADLLPVDSNNLNYTDEATIFVNFNESMDPLSLTLSGTLASYATYTWKDTTTLEITPTLTWPQTSNADITIDADKLTGVSVSISKTFAAYPATLYIAESGDDTYGGSSSSPLSSIDIAMDGIGRLYTTGTIYISEGTYTLTSPLVLAEGVNVIGGYDTSFSSYMPLSYVTEIDLSTSTLTSSSSAPLSVTTATDLSNTITIKGCFFKNIASGARYTAGVFIDSSPVDLIDCSTDGGTGSSYSAGIVFAGTTSVNSVSTIITSTIGGGSGDTAYGIYTLSNTTITLNQTTVTGRLSGAGNSYGIYTTTANLTIDDTNTIEAGVSTGEDIMCGLYIGGTSVVSVGVTTGKDTIYGGYTGTSSGISYGIYITGNPTVTITNCTLITAVPYSNAESASTSYAIKIGKSEITSYAPTVKINANTIYGSDNNTAYGIALDSLATASNIIISNNIISPGYNSSSTSTTGAGIEIIGSTNTFPTTLIRNNTIISAASARATIEINGTGGGTVAPYIENNILMNLGEIPCIREISSNASPKLLLHNLFYNASGNYYTDNSYGTLTYINELNNPTKVNGAISGGDVGGNIIVTNLNDVFAGGTGLSSSYSEFTSFDFSLSPTISSAIAEGGINGSGLPVPWDFTEDRIGTPRTADSSFTGRGWSIGAYEQDTYSSDWQYIGTPNITKGAAIENFDLEIGPSGTIYIAYTTSSDNVIHLLTYNTTNDTWDTFDSDPGTVNENNSNEYLSLMDMCVTDASGTDLVYLTFCDATNNGKATLLQSSGSGWTTIGTVSSDKVSDLSITAFAENDIRVAYTDTTADGYLAQWSDSGEIYSTIAANNVSSADITVATTGNTYYTYVNSNQELFVTYYDGETLTNVNGATPLQSGIIDASMTINTTNNLIIGKINSGLVLSSSIYTTTSWDTTNIDSNLSQEVAVTVDNSDIPYAAYQFSIEGSVCVKKYNATSWSSVGTTPITSGRSDCIKIRVSTAPVIGFKSGNTSSSTNGVATVMLYK